MLIDPAAIEAEAATRTRHVLTQPETRTAFEQVLADITADPETQASGAAMLAALEADPALSQAAARLVAAIGQLPELQQSVNELVREHPGATREELQAQLSARIRDNWSTPAISQAWLRAWKGLLRKLDIGVTPPGFETIRARFKAYVNARSAHWSERLIELNGGQEPTPERATQLYLDHAWSEVRIQKFVDTSLSDPRLQRECVLVVRQLLGSNAIQIALREAAAAILIDPTVQDMTLALLRELIVAKPSADAIGQTLDRLLQAPVTAKAINLLMARLLANPEAPKIIVESLDRLGADKQLMDALDELFDRW